VCPRCFFTPVLFLGTALPSVLSGQGPFGQVPLFLRASALRYYDCPTTTNCPSPLASSSFAPRYWSGRSSLSYRLILPVSASLALGAWLEPGLLISRLPFAVLFPQRPSVLSRSRMTCRTSAPLSDPGGGVRLAWGALPFFCLPLSLPLSQQRKPSATNHLSGLNHAAFVLAVYASQTLSPRPMQDSLPVVRHTFPDEVHRFPCGLMRSC
jgi:hypothetical protein